MVVFHPKLFAEDWELRGDEAVMRGLRENMAQHRASQH